MIKEKKSRIFLDNAGTTQVSKTVLETIKKEYLNSEETVSVGVYEAKATLAKLLDAEPNDIVFTASGSASNHLAIWEHAFRRCDKGKHVLVSAIEHPSVLKAILRLSDYGFEVETVPVNSLGQVEVDSIVERLRPTTILVAVMYFNNEVGTLQPVEAIGRLLKEKGIAFHVDAVQALGKVNIINCADSMSFSAHKIHGPKGCGALYFSGGYSWDPLLLLDSDPNIAAFNCAILEAYAHLEQNLGKLNALKRRLLEGLLHLDSRIKINGALEGAHPSILNVNFPGRDGDGLVIQYDWEGIAVSSGSACSSGAMSASPVLMAMGMSEAEAKRSVRFSTSVYTTESEIDEVLRVTERILKG